MLTFIRRWALAAVLVPAAMPGAAAAQTATAATATAPTATAPALKAAYLYNFAKFTEWPGDALGPADSLVLCVVNDRAVFESLAELTKGRAIDGHAIVVTVVQPDASALLPCRLLFAAGLDATRSVALIDAVAGKPIFTVGDVPGFAQLGGVAGFFVQDGTLRFAINLNAARRAGMRLSSKLLTLARIVKEDRNATRR